MMNSDLQVYLLDPQKLRPETIAVTFAKTSRSPESFREIASELSDEKSAQFHEKWVVGYGHSSVAEHAVLHIAVENISRLAVEALESSRLASYTEKSTRYQKWESNAFYVPFELKSHPLLPVYMETCSLLFTRYKQALEAVRKVVEEENPRINNESEVSWERRLRSEYVDVCRFLLPAASLANVGVTMNARNLEHSLSKMLSNPLDEVRRMGEEIKTISQAELPTLVKYATPQPYLVNTCRSIEDLTCNIPWMESPFKEKWCCLQPITPTFEDDLLAAVIYRFTQYDYTQIRGAIQSMSMVEKGKIADLFLGNLADHDIPLRELEYGMLTFDITLDQGAYFELKRHRMMTQTPQRLTADMGYAVPRKICQAGMEGSYCEAMEIARATWQKIYNEMPHVASYVVPNGFNRRVLLTTNLRSTFHLISLRTAPNAHFSIRRVIYRMGELIVEALPILGKYLPIYGSESWKALEEKHFTRMA